MLTRIFKKPVALFFTIGKEDNWTVRTGTGIRTAPNTIVNVNFKRLNIRKIRILSQYNKLDVILYRVREKYKYSSKELIFIIS